MSDKKINEFRKFDVPCELRIEQREDNSQKIVGHAAVFNTIAGDGLWFREKIAPGAFNESIKTDDIRALWNHDPNFVLGRNKSGTLSLREDEKGLWVEIDPPDTQAARDLAVSIGRGDVSQMSFAFQAIKQSWEEIDGEPDLRTIEKVKLYDVSPVTFPFYEQTDVALRDHMQWKTSIKKQPLRRMRRKLQQRMRGIENE